MMIFFYYCRGFLLLFLGVFCSLFAKDPSFYPLLQNVQQQNLDGDTIEGVLQGGKPWGLWVCLAPNGSIIYKERYCLGKKQGKQEFFYPDGTLLKEQYYQEGVLDGIVREWFPGREDGKQRLRLEGKYQQGKPQGLWQTYTFEGFLHCKKNYQNGLLEGKVEERFPYIVEGKQQLRLQGQYHQGRREGLWQAFYLNGQQQLHQHYVSDCLEGKALEYNEEGGVRMETRFHQGVMDGKVITYYDNGKKKSVVEYQKGKKEGIYQLFYLKGSLACQGEYRDDLPEGLWQWFSPQKKLIAKNLFVGGKGTMYQLYSSGEKHSMVHFEKGVAHGEQKHWYRSGKIKKIENYCHGQREGERSIK